MNQSSSPLIASWHVVLWRRFGSWLYPMPRRAAEDIAFAVARFYAKGGALMSYYMVRPSRTQPPGLPCYLALMVPRVKGTKCPIDTSSIGAYLGVRSSTDHPVVVKSRDSRRFFYALCLFAAVPWRHELWAHDWRALLDNVIRL